MAEFGDHWVRKIQFVFKRVDTNGNGVLAHDDLTQMGERHIKVSKMNRTEAEATKEIYEQIWNIYYKPFAGNDGCTSEDLLENIKKAGKHSLMATAYHLFNACFDTIDHKKSGFITVNEYKIFFHILGIKEVYAKEAFDALDTNHDDVISRGEFITAGIDYLTLEKKGVPEDYFFGKLV